MDTSYYKKHSRETTMFHNFPEYVLLRDKLIPEAEERAYEVSGRKPYIEGGCQTQEGRDLMKNWGDEWSLIFHQKMNKLAREGGLTRP
jgi:hypothetical protein